VTLLLYIAEGVEEHAPWRMPVAEAETDRLRSGARARLSGRSRAGIAATGATSSTSRHRAERRFVLLLDARIATAGCRFEPGAIDDRDAAA
jgi:hypothetical protein